MDYGLDLGILVSHQSDSLLWSLQVHCVNEKRIFVTDTTETRVGSGSNCWWVT